MERRVRNMGTATINIANKTDAIIATISEKIFTDRYQQFINNGYLVEIIPDTTEPETGSIQVHVRSLHKTQSSVVHADYIDFIESDYLLIKPGSSEMLDMDDLTFIKRDFYNVAFGVTFALTFDPYTWKNHYCTEGKLTITIKQLATKND